MKQLEHLDKYVIVPNVGFYGGFKYDGKDVFLCNDHDTDTDYDMHVIQRIENNMLITDLERSYAFLKSNEITYKQYNASEESRAAYKWAYKNPEKFEVSKAVADDLVEYKEYSKALGSIKADKDSLGNTISGSRQKKVVQYISSLDVEYGAKLVLYKTEYPSDDTYNDIIIRYVSGIEELNAQQKVTILKELGFTVDDRGNVTW